MVPEYHIQEKVFEARPIVAFRAQAVSSGRDVLLKLPLRGSEYQHGLDQLQREQVLCSRLNFPGKLEFDTVETADGIVLWEAELDHRVFLRELINKERLSVEDSLCVAYQLADNLIELHRQNIIIGRISPDVLLLDKNDDTLFIADLSWAREGNRTDIQCFPDGGMALENLAYIAPEYLGRFSQDVDARADLYSVGVLCYEMLTGQLPVVAQDVLQWFHTVATKEIPSPSTINPFVPEIVGQIVLRCLRVDPNSRYQSAYGLQKDLECCLLQWRKRREVFFFPLARYDVASTFEVSDRFCGRHAELELLHTALNRVTVAGIEVVMVAGTAGVGKTRLFKEFCHQARGEAIFAHIKFRPLATEPVYWPVAQVLEQVLAWILSQGQDELANWKEKIINRLGTNLGLIAQIVPNIEQLAGELPKPKVSSPLENMERLHLVLSQFIELVTEVRPLVLIIDDLQWADPGSLQMLHAILADWKCKRILMLGAYRLEEVPPDHIVQQEVMKLKRSGLNVHRLILAPLNLKEVEELVVFTFSCSRDESKALSRFLYNKTKGNVLFIKEVLYSMYRQGQIVFRPQTGSWQWDLEHGEPSLGGNDVVSLLVTRIGLLASTDKNTLCLAAAIGTDFSPDLLARLSGKDDQVTFLSLKQLTQAGFLQRSDSNKLSFVHDRVHQAAYQQLSAAAKPAIHYRLAHLLLDSCGSEQLSGKGRELFLTAVNHLNLGLDMVINKGEQVRAAQLNLAAGCQAKEAAMFTAALGYFETGLTILPGNAWEKNHELAFKLSCQYLECLYLCGDVEAGDEYYKKLEQMITAELERTQLHLIKILFATKKGFNKEAIDIGLKGLQELGCYFPKNPSLPYLAWEFLKMELILRRGGVKRLRAVAPAVDPKQEAIYNLFIAMGPCVYNLDEKLLLALSLKTCELSLQCGGFANSASAYMTLAMVYIVKFRNFKWGLALSQSALELANKYSTDADKALVYFLYGAFCLPWLEHVREATAYLEQATTCGFGVCDLTVAGYAMTLQVINHHFQGMALAELGREIEHNLAFAPKVKDPYYRHTLTIYRQLVRCLQGRTQCADSFSDETVQEEDFLDTFHGVKVRDRDKFDYYLLKGEMCYLLGRYDQAQALLAEANKLRALYFGEVYLADLDFYTALSVLADCQRLSISDKMRMRRQVIPAYRRLRQWARHCPANFAARALLVAAELARYRNQRTQAAQLYEAAIASAKQHGYINIAAIAYECAARFHFQSDLPVAAQGYLEEAYQDYRRWGLITKVRELEQQHPWLKKAGIKSPNAALVSPAQPRISNLKSAIDINALVRSTRILSREIRLEKLLKQMIHVLAQDAGAHTAVLLLVKDGQLYVEAVLVSDRGEPNIEVLQSLPVSESQLLPQQVVSFVARTRQRVLLDRTLRDDMFGDDPYIVNHKPASLLCLPIVHQNQLFGILYLENRRISGCFHSSWVEVLMLLSGQIAISIENARLYQRLEHLNTTLEEQVQERTKKLERVHHQTVSALMEQSRLEERNRIAREIHDTIGHTLTGVLMQIEAAKRLAVKDRRLAQTKMEAALKSVRRGLDEVRRSVHLLHEGDTVPDNERLVGLLKAIMETTGVTITYCLAPDIKLNPIQRHVIYRALQEGITNGIRHGNSQSFDLKVSIDEIDNKQQVRFILRDNGCGSSEVKFGFGLNSMLHRVQELGGSLQVDTKPGDGFTLTLAFPLSTSQRQAETAL